MIISDTLTLVFNLTCLIFEVTREAARQGTFREGVLRVNSVLPLLKAQKVTPDQLIIEYTEIRYPQFIPIHFTIAPFCQGIG